MLHVFRRLLHCSPFVSVNFTIRSLRRRDSAEDITMLSAMENYARICSFVATQQRSLFEEEIPSVMDPSTTGASAEISVWRMFLALIPPLIVIVISYHLKLQITRMIIISISRTIFQLLLAGYVLLSFIFDMHSPFVVMAYLLVMTVIAAMEATGRQLRTYPGHFWHSLLAIMASGGLIGMYGAVVVYHPTPWWEPHVMVPTAGMIIGNAISGPALAVDRLLADIAEKRHESETRLAFGASRLESVLPTMRAAVLAALLPNLNQMSVVGLVSIPGMMTGQLLSGSTPLVAAEYQMSILWLIFATAAVSTYISVLLVISQGVFDNDHRLSQGRIIKRSGKVSCDGYIYLMGKSFYTYMKTKCASVVNFAGVNTLPMGQRQGQGQGYEMVREQSAHGLLSSTPSSSSSSSGQPIFSIRRGLRHQPPHTTKPPLSSGVDEVVRVIDRDATSTELDDVEIATRGPERTTDIHPVQDTDADQSDVDDPETITGKVFYTFVHNDPTDHTDVDTALTNEVLFEADGFNVLSGVIPLFASTQSSRGWEEEVGVDGGGSLGGVQGIHLSLRKGK